MEKNQESVDSKKENLSHLDVVAQMKEKNAFFVHTVQVGDALDVSENNKSIDTRKLSVADKLDLLYGVNPTLSASTVRPNTNDGTFFGGFGVIFSHGEIASVSRGEDGSVVLSLTERKVIGGDRNSSEDIDRAIDRQNFGHGKSYNEIILKNPEVSAGFMKLETMAKRTSYEDEESTYYDGEKVVTKIGVVDFSNPVDKFGKPTGENFDKPFSVLLEMNKRGKTMFMDDSNQMYIIRKIDEKAKRVEFVAAPITPVQFSDAYGKERMNKYNKQEIADRLKESLASKGVVLH
ncbi:MAG: hypothetical protein WC444_01860 [Candidatus Paceibacterota bacterium]